MQIYKKIRDLIRNQTYKPGDLLPTESELCETHGASRPTIAKALNILAEEKLVRRRAGFGTQVLAPGRSGLKVGLLIPQLGITEIFEPICASISETAGIAGMQIVRPAELGRRLDHKALTELLVDQFIKTKVQGVFFAPVEHIDDQEEFNMGIVRRLSENGIPIVLLDRDVHPWPRHTRCDLVGIENIEAGYIIGSHLLEMGCKRLAFVTVEKPAMTVRLRRIGSREALIHAGLPAKSLLKVEFLPDQLETTAQKLKEKKADGIICANDATAARLLRALLDIGTDIPGTMKVCGFDDVKYASLLSVPLTTYHQPCRDIGKIATEIMLNRIRHPDSPIHRVTLQGHLVVRKSTAGAPKK